MGTDAGTVFWAFIRDEMEVAPLHGMDAFRRPRDGAIEAPDLYRLLCRKWLDIGTLVGARLDRSWGSRSSTDKSCLSALPDSAAE